MSDTTATVVTPSDLATQAFLTRWDLELLVADRHPFLRLRFPPPSGSSSGDMTQMLQEITTEMKKMSDQNAQVAADVAQLTADMGVMRTGLAALQQKISDLQGSANNVGVPPALQAQIDDVHAFAQAMGAAAGVTQEPPPPPPAPASTP